MKIKFLSLDTTSTLSMDVSQRLLFDSLSKYFEEPENFKTSNNPKTFLNDLSDAFKEADVVLVGAETSVYVATKKLLFRALSLPTEVNENIYSLISVASSRTSEEERTEHATLPKKCVEFASDNGLFSGFAMQAGKQWFVFVPMGTRKLELMVEAHIMPFITGTLGLEAAEEPANDEIQSEIYEAISKGVFALRQAEATVAFAATKSAAFVMESCKKIEHSEDVVFFTEYFKERTDSNVKQYIIDLAVGARDSREKTHYGIAISNVLKSENENSYFMYVALADEKSAKVAKVFGEENEPTQALVSAAISTAFSLIYDKSVERFEKKKGGADYSKKGAEELSTEVEKNIRKKRIGTIIRAFCAVVGFGLLVAVALWLFL